MGDARTARAELVLARESSLALRHVPLRPDPLSSLALALGEVDDTLGEAAEVIVDLLPVTPARRRQQLRSAIRRERSSSSGSPLDEVWDAVRGGPSRGRQQRRPRLGPAGTMEGLDDRAEVRHRLAKLSSTEPLFGLQLLVWARSEIPGRAEAHLHALVACLEQFAGENHLRVVGRNLGVMHLGSDLWWRRRRFDRRVASGLFRPAGESFVTVSEIAGLLKPPTVHCRAPKVVRSGGVIPPPPFGLPTYAGQPGLLPLGTVQGSDGERVVGLPLAETLFTAHFGRAGFGKTETAVMQFVALVRAGRGGMFLDPHGDALERISPCLTDMADRVLEINLARGRDQVQAGWNVLSMEGLGAVDVEARVSALASSFAAALSWDDRNTRALNLVTMAAQSLCELALRLPPKLAPTIFQITTLLSNDDWRGEVLPYLSRTSRDFWSTRFTKLAAEAITPVTNLLDRLRASSGVAALFGSSRSTYDVRAAMDAGAAVLACPAGIGDKDKLVFSLFLFDLFRATLSRRDILPAQRRPFHAFLDECQLADSGQSSETVARMLREGRKFGLRVHAMTQQPTALSKVTLNAMLTNRSHLFSTVVGAESAAVLSKEWAGLVDPRTITRLPRYHFLVSATLGGEVTPPFLVRGLRVEDLWGEVHRPDDVPAMNAVVDATMKRRPVGDILADLDTLDDRILAHLQGAAPATAEAPVVPIGPRPRPDRVRWRAD